MDFDPSTAKPEPDAPGFDPTTATAVEDAPAGDFDPGTAQPEKKTPTTWQKVRLAAKLLPEIMPEFKPPGTPESRKALIDKVVPFQQRMIASALTPLGVGGFAKPDPNATSAGVARAGDEFVVNQMTPANLFLLHGLGLTGQAAAAGSTAAKLAMAGGSAYFGGSMAKTAGEQAGEASVDDPTDTKAQRAAKWTAAGLSGLGSIAATIGLVPEFAKYVNGKQPVEAIDNLNAAAKNAKTPDEAQAAQQARDQYISWWESQLQDHDRLAKSPQGAALLRQQLSAQERYSQRRAKDFLRAKIDEVKQSIGDRQLAGPETVDAAPEQVLPKQEPTVEDGDAIPATVELSDKALDVADSAAQEGGEPFQPYTPPVRPPAARATSATPEADAQAVVEKVDSDRVKNKAIEKAASPPAAQEPTKTAPNAAPEATVEETGKPTKELPEPSAAGEFDASTATPEEIPATFEEPEPNSESAFARGPVEEEPAAPAPAAAEQPAPPEPTGPKPVPEGTKFLYEQGGHKYFQMPDPEAPRGSRTVDLPTLEKEGFDTENLPGDEATEILQPHEQALSDLDDAVTDPESTRGTVVRMARKLAKKGIIDPAALPEIERIGKDRDMGAEDVASQLKGDIEYARKKAEGPPRGAPQAEAVDETPPHEEEGIPVTLEHGGQGGFIDPKLMAVVASGGSGAAYGYAHGKTPEERLHKAISYGATAALASYLLMKVPEAFGSQGGKAVGFRALRNTLMGRDVPNLRAASEPATDAAFRLAYARVYGKAKGLDLAAKVLGDHQNDKVFAEKLGSVLVQDMQEAKLLQLHDELAKAATPDEEHAIQEQIDNVKPVWEMPATQINSAAEFDAALKDPEIQAAIDRHKQLVQAQAEAAHTALGGKLAAAGPNTGAFINTEAIIAGDDMLDGSSRGNLQNPLKKKSAFNQGRSGTAEQYEIDYNRQVARMAEGNAERLAHRQYYDTLEEEGLAKRLPPGERPEGPDAGKYRRERTQELSTTGKVENTWIRKDIFGEHRQLMNTDSPLDNHLAVLTARVLNTVQLKSLTDPTFHVANIISSIAGSPGGGSMLADIGRKFPGVDIADALTRLSTKVRDVAADTPEMRAAAAEVARIGAMREGHPGVVQAVDKAGRLVMNDLYDNLVEQGLAPDRDGPRRDFINQVGQYNSRLMGKTKAFMKEAGFSPFIVAGQNFNKLAIKRVTSMPGATPAGGGAAAQMIATNLAGLAAIGGTIAATNYLVSGKPGGPTGTPVGAIGWMGKDDKGKDVLHVVDPLKWTNMRRGLRITGANAFLSGNTTGRDLNHMGGQALEDIKNGVVGPWAGPAINATSVLFTGKSMSGFQEAEKANPLDHTNTPTLDQDKNNLVAAGSELNPHVAAFLQGGREKNPTDFNAAAASKGLVKSLLKAVGKSELKPGDTDRGPAETALYKKEVAQSQRTISQQSLAEKWGNLNKADRISGLRTMLRAAEDNPEAKGLPAEELATFREKQVYNLMDDVAAVRHGMTNSDRMVKDLGVEDGSRARYLAERLLSRPEGAMQRDYLKDQVAKGNLTPDVFEKLLPILQSHGWKRTW